MRGQWPIVDYSKEHNIIWIEDDCDANGTAKRSITNDAENVIGHFRNIYGSSICVVYRDTDMEWWEIYEGESDNWMRHGKSVLFRPWNGMVWDILSN